MCFKKKEKRRSLVYDFVSPGSKMVANSRRSQPIRDAILSLKFKHGVTGHPRDVNELCIAATGVLGIDL